MQVMNKVFIDGSAGTTGLRIYERLVEREDIHILTLPEKMRKDPDARKEMLNTADVVFLCLPDDAAIEAVSFIENTEVTVLDTSTAHRTEKGWTYGLPELSVRHEQEIIASKRIAVPGCHACGFIALVHPLVKTGVLKREAQIYCHSITGYSGGGKKMIAQYEERPKDSLLTAPRQYALAQTHKHLKEMKAISGIASEPIFCPIVSSYYSGMLVTVALFADQLSDGNSIDDVRSVLKERYGEGEIVSYCDDADEQGYMSAVRLSGKDSMQISVYGNDSRILLTARYDNLGKGASGAAIQCMNLVLGADVATGLDL